MFALPLSSDFKYSSVFDLNERIFKNGVNLENIQQKLYTDYILPLSLGTATTGIIDSDLTYNSFKEINDIYLKVLSFENKYSESSRDLYSRWMAGESLNNDNTDWLDLYLKVWDKIKYANQEPDTQGAQG